MQTKQCNLQAIFTWIFTNDINCAVLIETKLRFFRISIKQLTYYYGIATPDSKPLKNMITMGKGDTSDLRMIIKWVTKMSFQSPILEWVTYSPKYCKHTENSQENEIHFRQTLDIINLSCIYSFLEIFVACVQRRPWASVHGGDHESGLKIEYDLKFIIHPTCNTQMDCAVSAEIKTSWPGIHKNQLTRI